MTDRPGAESQTQVRPESAATPDPLYLFACHLEWQKERNRRAFEELLAALDDPNEEVRLVAEYFLDQPSPRRRFAYANSDTDDW